MSDRDMDLSDVSDVDDDKYSEMPEFKREQLLAEKHAEQVKKKQRLSLLKEKAKVNRDESLDDFADDLNYLDEIIDETLDKPLEEDVYEKTLFNDEAVTVHKPEQAEAVKHVNAALANSAKVSRSRVINILEHPNHNEYLSGALVNVYVSLDAPKMALVGNPRAAQNLRTLADTLPNLIGQHVVFQVESALKCEPYDVFGTKHVNCDHKSKRFMAKCEHVLTGRVLNVNPEVFKLQLMVSVNDVCNMPFYEDDLNFGDEEFAVFLKQVANNLKSFTFTDDDVQLILERKLFDKAAQPKQGKTSLIAEIQRCTHEIELLAEAAQQDPSQLPRLQEHERRRQELVEELKKYKGPAGPSTTYALKTSSLLCASDDLGGKGVVRKTTKPTPMIMVPNMKTDQFQNEPAEGTHRFKRTLNDLNMTKQNDLINAYTHVSGAYPQYLKNMSMDLKPPQGKDHFAGFERINLKEYAAQSRSGA